MSSPLYRKRDISKLPIKQKRDNQNAFIDHVQAFDVENVERWREE